MARRRDLAFFSIPLDSPRTLWDSFPGEPRMLMTPIQSVRQLFGFLATLNLLQLKLLLRNRRMAFRFPSLVFRNYMMLVQKDRWRSVSIDELVPPARNLELILVHLEPKGLVAPLDELVYLSLLTKYRQPTSIFEIGTFHGRTALHFALNSPPDCTILTLDLPEEERSRVIHQTNKYDADLIRHCEVGVDYSRSTVAHKIRQLRGDSQTFDFSPYFGSVDIVFIDGAHHYAVVISDTKNALKMVKPGGYIIWHDFANYGPYHDVTRAVLDLLPADEILQIGSSQLAVYRKASNAPVAVPPAESLASGDAAKLS